MKDHTPQDAMYHLPYCPYCDTPVKVDQNATNGITPVETGPKKGCEFCNPLPVTKDK